MKTTSTTKYLMSLFCFCVLILTSFSSVFALKTCDFPAIFNFGDSNSETGSFAAAFFPPNSVYGKTYFGTATRRFTDGRVTIDFIAKSFGLPYLSAYLESLGSNFTHGANFASMASSIRLPNKIIPNGGFIANAAYSPFYLDIQVAQFSQFKPRSQMIREQGGIFASLMPKEEYFSKGLYTIDIGQNDLAAGFFDNMSVGQVNASVPDMINKLSINIKNLYKLGGRSFWIHNTGPIGCLPYILTQFPTAMKDSVGCSKPHNEVAQNFNHHLKNAVLQLRKDFPSAAFTYVDVYSVKYLLFKEPEKYGFKLPLVACCGFGGKHNYSRTIDCGKSVVVNGRKLTVDSCDRPSVRVSWNGVHLTEAASKFVFDQISTGAFSDPPVPLKMACHTALYHY